MYQLLFVDDDKDAAREYAELVESFTRLRPLVCSTQDEAIEAVKNNQIAVAVLDQRMPEVEGTDLYRALRAVSPRLRAIMLSGCFLVRLIIPISATP